MHEGELRFVQASGSGRTWATGTSPVSGIFAYVRSMSYTSGATINVVNERGIPDHNKLVSRQPIAVTVNCAWTGGIPSAASGSGASVPMFHLEYRASAAETPTTGQYLQFMGVPLVSTQWTEGDEDTMAFTFQALAMVGPTGSGFLS
jgi:hypothetical protein